MKTIITLHKNARLIFLALLICAFIIPVQAAQITWLGGNDSWDNANAWDTGTVPGSTDEVFINSGEVTTTGGIISRAKHIFVAAGAKLTVKDESTLVLDNSDEAPPIENEGTIQMDGYCEIIAAYVSLYHYKSGHGIYNSGKFTVGVTGEILMYEIQRHGISNQDQGHFINRGAIDISDVGSYAIFNDYLFDNHAYINVNLGNLTQPRCIATKRVFRNYGNAVLDLNGGKNGIRNFHAGRFYNYGDINITNSDREALSNGARFYNKNSGEVRVGNAGYCGVFNDYRLINEGYIDIDDSFYAGFRSDDEFINTGHLLISNSVQADFLNFSSASFTENSGRMDFLSEQAWAIDNQGEFINQDNGELLVKHKIYAGNEIFQNFGFIISEAVNNNSVLDYNNFIQEGVFEDINDRLGAGFLNQEVVLSKFNGTLQDGVTESNFLEMNNIDRVKINKYVYSDAIKTKEVGTYDFGSNEFTPNNSSVGLTQLFFEIRITNSNHTKMCQVNLNAPILPYVISNHHQDWQAAETKAATNIDELNIFPNPTTGTLHFNSEIFNKSASTIQIYSSIGQLVQQSQVSKFASPTMTLANDLTNGFYLIRVSQNGEVIDSKRIQLLR